jgi:hypothetical protein
MSNSLPETSQVPQVADNTPAAEGEAITDATDVTLTNPARGLYVGTGGDISVTLIADPDEELVFKNVPSGALLPLGVKKILGNTGTSHTATDLIAVR